VSIVRGLVDTNRSIDPWFRAQTLLQRMQNLSNRNSVDSTLVELRLERVKAFIGHFGVENVEAPNLNIFPVGQVLGDWTLTGYYLDEESLELKNIIKIRLFWRFANIEEDYIQEMQTDNLVTNGGFEQTAGIGGDIPLGFAKERYSSYSLPFTHRSVVVSYRNNKPTLCAQLNNQHGTVPSGYLSEENPNLSDYYLVGAWVKGDKETSYVGILNLGPNIPDSERNRYVKPRFEKDGWTYHTEILSLPPSTTDIQVELISWGNDTSCFDNVFIIPIEPPS